MALLAFLLLERLVALVVAVPECRGVHLYRDGQCLDVLEQQGEPLGCQDVLYCQGEPLPLVHDHWLVWLAGLARQDLPPAVEVCHSVQ